MRTVIACLALAGLLFAVGATTVMPTNFRDTGGIFGVAVKKAPSVAEYWCGGVNGGKGGGILAV